MELNKFKEILKNNGIVGAGGAGFPTYAKLSSSVDTVLLNCAECEPLLYTDAVCSIMTTAKKLGIPKRQVITNGFFSKNTDKIREVAWRLAKSGVNDLLLSVDAFHQETIPLCVVKEFATEPFKKRRCTVRSKRGGDKTA